jgi:hypothetical protein
VDERDKVKPLGSARALTPYSTWLVRTEMRMESELLLRLRLTIGIQVAQSTSML